MVDGIILKNIGSNIVLNNGKAIFIPAYRVVIPWRKNVSTPIRNGLETNYGYEGGLYNPVITIEGFLDYDLMGSDIEVNGEQATVVNIDLLRQLVLFREDLSPGNDSRLVMIGKWNDSVDIIGLDSGNTGFPVIVESITIRYNSQHAENRETPFTMVLREVK